MFYETLKAICKEKHTSPTAVCEAIGISKNHVTRWKNGKSPRLDVLTRIAQHLKVRPAKLIPKE